MKTMKNKILYLIGLMTIFLSIIVLIYMQSELINDYFSKLMLGVTSVALVTAMLQLLIMWIVKRQKKGAVFFINKTEDENLIDEVIYKLHKHGIVCYPTKDIILHSDTETLANQMQASSLVVVLLRNGYEESPYMQNLIKMAKKEKHKNVVFFSLSPEIGAPQKFRQVVPILLKDCETESDDVADTIAKNIMGRIQR